MNGQQAAAWEMMERTEKLRCRTKAKSQFGPNSSFHGAGEKNNKKRAGHCTGDSRRSDLLISCHPVYKAFSASPTV